jgi:hypothetical protein
MFNKLNFLSFLFIFNSCIELSDNKNEIIFETTDYNSARNSILFIKSGGATVGDSYQISVLPYQDKLKDSDTGNVFIADDHDGSISNDTSRVNVRWLGYDTLKISFDKSLRVFKMNTKAKNVIIIYDSLSLTK